MFRSLEFHLQSDYDKTSAWSETGSVATTGYYVWEVPGKPFSIQLNLDVVDRLQQDVVRGFGLVPRRGAEVGGILLGNANTGGFTACVEDYELVPIEYKRGPSYLLSDEDAEAFEAALDQLRKDYDKSFRPIGFFRSHTRDGVGLGEEDLELLSKYFPDPETIVLLIRPFATKPSVAGFYCKENGQFPEGAPLVEFPFRRKDLAPDEAGPRERLEPSQREELGEREESFQQPRRWPIQHVQRIDSEDKQRLEPEGEVKAKPLRGWFWAPLSFIFLVVGLALGFYAAIAVRPNAIRGNPFHVSLTVARSGSDLQVTWDRQSLGIKTAEKGILTIEDGTYTKPTDLAAGELQSGSVVIYRPVTKHVRFRLDLLIKDRDTLSESVEWTQ